MGMTMTQKILAAHAGLPSVEAGQKSNLQPDADTDGYSWIQKRIHRNR